MSAILMVSSWSQAQVACSQQFQKPLSPQSKIFYANFEADFNRARQRYFKKIKELKTTRPRAYQPTIQTLRDLRLDEDFTMAGFYKRYMKFMNIRVKNKEDILEPALIYTNSDGTIKIVPYGQEVPDEESWKLASVLSSHKFFQVLEQGYFPLGNPRMGDQNTGLSVITHDLFGHLGAFVKETHYMKEIKRLASSILKLSSSDGDFDFRAGRSRVAHLAEFFLEDFRYVPSSLRESLKALMLLPATMTEMESMDVDFMIHTLSQVSAQARQQKLQELWSHLDHFVHRLGGIERDDHFYPSPGKVSSDHILHELHQQWLSYQQSPQAYPDSFSAILLGSLQVHLLHLSRFDLSEMIDELTSDAGPSLRALSMMKTPSFRKTYPRVEYLIPRHITR